jgi:hypothetical protein
MMTPMNTPIRTYAAAALVLFFSSFVLVKTTLHITVRDELGNIVPGATIQLFAKEEDYTKEQNVVFEGTTDEKGIVKFKEVDPVSYFVIVRKGEKDNSGGAEKTPKLEEKKINKVTIIIQ